MYIEIFCCVGVGLASSMARAFDFYRHSKRTLEVSKGCGFDPRVGLLFFFVARKHNLLLYSGDPNLRLNYIILDLSCIILLKST